MQGLEHNMTHSDKHPTFYDFFPTVKHIECLLASQINQIHNLFASKFHNIIGILIVAIKTACQFHKSTFIAEINGGRVCNDN